MMQYDAVQYDAVQYDTMQYTFDQMLNQYEMHLLSLLGESNHTQRG